MTEWRRGSIAAANRTLVDGPTWTPSMGRTTKFIEREQDDST